MQRLLRSRLDFGTVLEPWGSHGGVLGGRDTVLSSLVRAQSCGWGQEWDWEWGGVQAREGQVHLRAAQGAGSAERGQPSPEPHGTSQLKGRRGRSATEEKWPAISRKKTAPGQTIITSSKHGQEKEFSKVPAGIGNVEATGPSQGLVLERTGLGER